MKRRMEEETMAFQKSIITTCNVDPSWVDRSLAKLTASNP
jgi:hypothetical protein